MFSELENFKKIYLTYNSNKKHKNKELASQKIRSPIWRKLWYFTQKHISKWICRKHTDYERERHIFIKTNSSQN